MGRHLPHFKIGTIQTLLLLAVSVFVFTNTGVGASDLTNRKITLQSPTAGAVTSHTFNFNIATGTILGSIEFEYCENDPFVGNPCTPPVGLSLTAATVSGQTGETGFIKHPTSTVNRFVLGRFPNFPTPGPVSYQFDNVINPSDPNRSYFVRISTFSSVDASGPRIDSGTVVFSTSKSISVGGYVPPYITFCTGVSVAIDCTTSTGFSLDLGELTRNAPATATSQFSTATNDFTGYFVSLFGGTMTSGNNIIPALAVNSPSIPGTSQFGLNLRANTSPTFGQERVGSGSASAAPGYNTPNSFRFVPGETLVNSPLSTDFNRFTVSYLVNVSSAQNPGVYNTTLTYIAVASF